MDIQERISANLQEWFAALSSRLRRVRVACGDWSRICGGNWQEFNKGSTQVGVFFDPPYLTSGRDTNLYARETDGKMNRKIEQWCLERGVKSNYRIVIAGYEDEYQGLQDAGWGMIKWKTQGGYGNRKKSGKNLNRFRERLYYSPACLKDT